MTMPIKLSTWVALLVSCLVKTTTINLCSVFKWIYGKKGIKRKNCFGYSANLEFFSYGLLFESFPCEDKSSPRKQFQDMTE